MALLEDFDPTLQLPPDLMHDLFEGAFPFVLQGLFDDGIICEGDLEKAVMFEYGRNDRPNRPAELSTAFLLQGHNERHRFTKVYVPFPSLCTDFCLQHSQRE